MRKEPPKKKETKMLRGVEGFYYLTERVLMSPFPGEDGIGDIAGHLNEAHENHYLVYNLSEYKYDYNMFKAAVMEYSFPGVPCPSLDSLFMICTSMQSWLLIDPKHVVVLHCQGTKGRSALVAACFLAFFHQKEFDGGPKEALRCLCQISGDSSGNPL